MILSKGFIIDRVITQLDTFSNCANAVPCNVTVSEFLMLRSINSQLLLVISEMNRVQSNCLLRLVQMLNQSVRHLDCVFASAHLAI